MLNYKSYANVAFFLMIIHRLHYTAIFFKTFKPPSPYVGSFLIKERYIRGVFCYLWIVLWIGANY